MTTKARAFPRKPSDNYKNLLAMYANMHSEGYLIRGDLHVSAESAYGGFGLLKFVPKILDLCRRHKARSVLDYGSGKGKQYTIPYGGYENVGAYWDVLTSCYDPGVKEFSKVPKGQFDGVISTDVLEHIPMEDIPWVIEEMFVLARKFVFLNVACYPALAKMPDGQNAHVTVRSPDWWYGVVFTIALGYPEVDFFLSATTDKGGSAIFKRGVDYVIPEGEHG